MQIPLRMKMKLIPRAIPLVLRCWHKPKFDLVPSTQYFLLNTGRIDLIFHQLQFRSINPDSFKADNPPD